MEQALAVQLLLNSVNFVIKVTEYQMVAVGIEIVVVVVVAVVGAVVATTTASVAPLVFAEEGAVVVKS